MKKKDIQKTLGKKPFFDDSNVFLAIEYNDGVKEFDHVIIEGKKTHFIGYPKGFLLKMSGIFRSTKKVIPFDEISHFEFITDKERALFNIVFRNAVDRTITFHIQPYDLPDLRNFLNKNCEHIPFKTIKDKNIIKKYYKNEFYNKDLPDFFCDEINKSNKSSKVFLAIGSIGFLLLGFIAMLLGNEDPYFTIVVLSAVIWISVSVVASISLGSQRDVFIKSWEDIKRGTNILHFKYNNGDQLILTEHLLVNYVKKIHKKKRKIGKISWELSHIKDLLKFVSSPSFETALGLLPNVTVLSNKCPHLIEYGKRDTAAVYFFYYDIKNIQVLRIIIQGPGDSYSACLDFPISEEITFDTKAFLRLRQNIERQHNKFGHMYVGEQEFKEIHGNEN